VIGRIKVVKVGKPGVKYAKGCGAGYGFLTDTNGEDRFFHANSVKGTDFDHLKEGLTVEFEPYTEEGRGLRAREVRLSPVQA
jgi:cold shock CspA family protein